MNAIPGSGNVMIPGNKRWDEFCSRLEGPEGCDFQDKPKFTWKCEGGNDKTYAEAILRDMGLSEREIIDSFIYFDDHGGHCDCEILFNVDV